MNRNDAHILLDSSHDLADNILRARQMRLAEQVEARRNAVEQRALDMTSDRDAAMSRYHDTMADIHRTHVLNDASANTLRSKLIEAQLAQMPQIQAQEQAMVELRRRELDQHAAHAELQNRLLQAKFEAMPQQNNINQSLFGNEPQSAADVERNLLESRRRDTMRSYADHLQNQNHWNMRDVLSWLPGVDSTKQKIASERQKIDEMTEQLNAPVIATEDEFNQQPSGKLINFNGQYIRKK